MRGSVKTVISLWWRWIIGSDFTDRLSADASMTAVTLYNNVSFGQEWHYEAHGG
jgi:hypothetical protein